MTEVDSRPSLTVTEHIWETAAIWVPSYTWMSEVREKLVAFCHRMGYAPVPRTLDMTQHRTAWVCDLPWPPHEGNHQECGHPSRKLVFEDGWTMRAYANVPADRREQVVRLTQSDMPSVLRLTHPVTVQAHWTGTL